MYEGFTIYGCTMYEEKAANAAFLNDGLSRACGTK